MDCPLNVFKKNLSLQDQTVIKNVAEPDKNDKKLIEMQTFLLAYFTAKVSLPLYLIC